MQFNGDRGQFSRQTAHGMIEPGPKTEVPSSPDPAEDASKGVEPAAAEQLSAEEQMALYEKELKENDWGHQPC
jgi:hypothetical protein